MKLIIKFPIEEKGGPGSGDFGHAGRPGHVGGSAGGSGSGGGGLEQTLSAKSTTADLRKYMPDEWTERGFPANQKVKGGSWDLHHKAVWEKVRDPMVTQIPRDQKGAYFIAEKYINKRVHDSEKALSKHGVRQTVEPSFTYLYDRLASTYNVDDYSLELMYKYKKGWYSGPKEFFSEWGYEIGSNADAAKFAATTESVKLPNGQVISFK